MRLLSTLCCAAVLAMTAYATPGLAVGSGTAATSPAPSASKPAETSTYSKDELVVAVSEFFGVTAEAAGAAVERVFRDYGRPTGYIAGQEYSGAITVGLRYGKGVLTLKQGGARTVFWQGPSVGFDWGGNASRAFILVYNLNDPDRIYRRFPGVDGSAYLIGGIGVNYLRGDQITLAPMRVGVGLRLGASAGYLSFSPKRRYFPF